MRVAIFSDVHGNSLALDAVLADVERAGGVDAFWFVGDAAAQGTTRRAACTALPRMPGLVAVRGNTDHYTIAETLPSTPTSCASPAKTGDEPRTRYAMVRNIYWTRGAVTATGGYDWLATCRSRSGLSSRTARASCSFTPRQAPTRAPASRRASPRPSLGKSWPPADADLVVVGHTHHPARPDRGRRAHLEPRQRELPFREVDDKRAMWTLLEADESGHTLDPPVRRVRRRGGRAAAGGSSPAGSGDYSQGVGELAGRRAQCRPQWPHHSRACVSLMDEVSRQPRGSAWMRQRGKDRETRDRA